MYKDNQEFFYSEDPAEIEKEKKIRQVQHHYLPHLMGGKEDKVKYVQTGKGNNTTGLGQQNGMVPHFEQPNETKRLQILKKMKMCLILGQAVQRWITIPLNNQKHSLV